VSGARGEPAWTVQASLGGAANLSAPVTIRQEGSADLRFSARLASRSLEFPLYYALRVARWREERAWMVELRHHKLYLEDPPPEVGSFSISHGYNLFTVGRLGRTRGTVLGVVAGVVIAHPENVVRGRPLESGGGIFGLGYYVAGPTAGALAAREIPLGDRWAIPVEALVSASWARVPVAGGDADVPNVALHGTIGVSRRLP
jgi:hypothetical protein